MADYDYSLFLAYAGTDLPWAEGYLIPALGLPADAVITSRSFRPGVPLPVEIERAVRASRVTVIILSHAFPASDWTVYSSITASSSAVESAADRLVLVLLEPVAVPGYLAAQPCLDCTDESRWAPATAQLRARLEQVEVTAEEIPCPYVGMLRYGEDDASRFYGRQQESEELLQMLLAHRFTLVVGASGSGKSSLVFAGLIPLLRKRKAEEWTIRVMRPGADPAARLKEALADLLTEEGVLNPPAQRLLLVIDQAEELFAQSAPAARDEFIEAVRQLREGRTASVLLAMRADFYADLLKSGLWPIAREQILDIGQLRGPALRQAIEQPANDLLVHLQPTLVERLMSEMADEPGALPFLQETLVLLWTRRQRRLLTLSAYTTLDSQGRSGLSLAMATRADQAFARLAAEQQKGARRLFLRLIQFGEGRPDTRRQEVLAKLHSDGDDEQQVEQVVNALAAERLLTLDRAPDSPDTKVDLAHDALIAGWPRLTEWVSELRQAELTRRRLESKADEWRRFGRGHDGLLDAAGLAEAQVWMATPAAADVGHSEDLRQLIGASAAHARRARRRRYAIGSLIVALIIGVLAAIAVGQTQLAQQQEAAAATAQALASAEVSARQLAESEAGARATAQAVAEDQRGEAERQREVAVARRLASESEQVRIQLPAQVPLSVLLGVESLKHTPTFQGDAALRRSLALLAEERARLDSLFAMANSSMLLEYSPDGRWMAAAHSTTLTVWDAVDGQEVLRVTSPSSAGIVPQIRTIAFSPDGERLVTGTDSGIVQVWAVPTGKMIAQMAHDDSVWSVAFGPDGSLVLSSDGGAAKVWRAASGRLVSTRESSSMLLSTFSRDGKLVASGYVTMTVWDASTGTELLTIERDHHLGLPVIRSIAFAPDGARVAWGEGAELFGGYTRYGGGPAPAVGGDVFVVDVATGERLLHLKHSDSVFSLAYSADGRYLLSASADGSAKVWDAATGAEVSRFAHAASVLGAAFTMDDDWVLSVSSDGIAYLWEARTGKEILRMATGANVRASGFAVSQAAQQVAIGYEDRSLAVWDTAGGVVFGPQHARPISQLLYDPSGAWLATASWDQSACTWDASSGRRIACVSHPAEITALAVSPDGSLLVSGSRDGSVRLWDPRTGSDKGSIPIQAGTISDLAFSADGSRLAVGAGLPSSGGWHLWRTMQLNMPVGSYAISVWEMQGVARIAQMQRESPVHSVAFLRDDRYLASGDDGGVSLWDVEGETKLFSTTHTLLANQVSVSPDGRWAASVESSWHRGMLESACAAEMPLVRVWEALTGVERWRAPYGGQWASALEFSPDGRYLVTIGQQIDVCPAGSPYAHSVRVWDAATGRQLLAASAPDFVTAAAFSPDGRWLAVGGIGTMTGVWDTHSWLKAMEFDTPEVWQMAWSPDSRSVTAAGVDKGGHPRVRRLAVQQEDLIAQACARVRRNLSAAEWSAYLGDEAYHATCPDVVDRAGAGGLDGPAGDGLAPEADGASNAPSISGDGMRVAFESEADNLVDGDTNRQADIFVADRAESTIQRVSVSSDGVEANGASRSPVLSENGRFVMFQSSASNLVSDDTDEEWNVFLHDLQSGTTTRLWSEEISGEYSPGEGQYAISNDGRHAVIAYVGGLLLCETVSGHCQLEELNLAGSTPNWPSISDEGRYVVFSSYAPTLTASDRNDKEDVFILDRTTGMIECLSVTGQGIVGDGLSTAPTLSPDGKQVVFESAATDLTDERLPDHYKILRVDLATREIAYVSPYGGGRRPAVSRDAAAVAYEATGARSAGEAGSLARSIFVNDRRNAEPILGSPSIYGGFANSDSIRPAVSADGRYVAFASYASDLVPGDLNGFRDIFVFDRTENSTTRLSVRALYPATETAPGVPNRMTEPVR